MTETITLPEKQAETIVVKSVKPKRVFSGFDIDISVELPDLTLRVPAKYGKIDSKVVREKLQIKHRVGDVEVENKPTPYKWAWLDSENKEYPEAQVKHFQVLPDGKEQETRPFTTGPLFQW